MLGSTIFMSIASVALFASSTCALPHPGKPEAYIPAANLNRLAKLMPESSLPAPVGELKYVVLGVGTQNYTCTGGNPDAAPGTTGAVATLYDIGTMLNQDSFAKWKIPTISPLALSLSDHPALLELGLKAQGYDHFLGHHFFSNATGTNTPIFALDQLKSPYPLAQVARVNDTAAPASACPGLKGEGTIKWLFLKDTKSASVGGIDTVYRLETAGGMAPLTCMDQPKSFEVKYAAQYWVFGPRK